MVDAPSHGPACAHEDALSADERFAEMVSALRAIPSFLREALDYAPGPGGSGRSFHDQLIEAASAREDVEHLIQTACEVFAEVQRARLPNRLKSEAEIVADWQDHQQRTDALIGRAA